MKIKCLKREVLGYTNGKTITHNTWLTNSNSIEYDYGEYNHKTFNIQYFADQPFIEVTQQEVLNANYSNNET